MCDEDYRLPAGKGGHRWITRPAQRGLMLMWMHPDVKELGGPKPTRFGYTEIASAACISLIEQGVSNVYFMPNATLAKEHSNKTMKHWIKTVPSVRNLLVVDNIDKKDPNNNTKVREFKNCSFYCHGAASPSDTSTIAVKFATIDEADRCKDDVGGEGSVIGLARGRFDTDAEGGRLRIFGSPTLDHNSEIQEFFDNQKDQFECEIPCPKCGEFSTLHWGEKDDQYGIKWDDLGDAVQSSETVRHVCRHCSKSWQQKEFKEAEKGCRWVSNTGYWFDADGDGNYKTHIEGIKAQDMTAGEFYDSIDDWVVTKPPPEHGIRLCKDGMGLYGPRKWSDKLRQFLAAWKKFKNDRDSADLKPFNNTYRGIVFKSEAEFEVPADELLDRREIYEDEIPKEVQFLTLGADFGGGYSKYQIDGHGANGERWAIRLRRIDGDAVDPNSAMYEDLHNVMSQEYERGDGQMLPIEMCILDGRYCMAAVKALAARDHKRRVVVLGDGKGLRRPMFEFDRNKCWDEESQCHWVSINPHKASQALYHKLKIPKDAAGYYHLPLGYMKDGEVKLVEDFNRLNILELVADKLTIKPDGLHHYGKDNTNVANETHDTSKYNGVAYIAATVHGNVVVNHDYIPGQAQIIARPAQPTTPTFDISDAY